MDTYVEPNLSPTTVDSYRINVEKHIIPHIGRVLLQELMPMHLQRLYRSLMESGRTDGKGGLSARSVRYVHRNINEALEHAMRMQIVSRNVASLVTLPKVRPYKAAVYDEQQLIELMKAAQGTDMEMIISLAVSLGLRRGELLGLRWSDIDFEGLTLTVSNNLVQTRKGSISKEPNPDKPEPKKDLIPGSRNNNMLKANSLCNPEADKLVEIAAAEQDPAKRQQYYRDLQHLVVQDVPLCPVYHDVCLYATKKDVRDLKLDPFFKPSLATTGIGK